MTEMNGSLTEGLKELNIEYDDEKLEKIATFYEMIIEKNKVMNLTRITDKDDFIVKHVLDSLLVTKALDIRNQKILDVGCGAGFPGVPIAVFFPEVRITLLDSLNKRLIFLNEVIEKIGLDNARTIHARAEELGKQKDHREQYDIVVSRAVAELSNLFELCIPFAKVGGYTVSYKSDDSDKEIEDSVYAGRILSGQKPEVKRFILPNTDIYRRFVMVKKSKPTPAKYPRNPSVIKKHPLIDGST